MLLAQHGFGKGELLTAGLSDGILDGVILSPRDESPEKMVSLVDSIRRKHGADAMVLMDPQLYALTLSTPRLGCLLEYYPASLSSGLSRATFSSPLRLQALAEQVLEMQAKFDLSRWISPSILISSFKDHSGQASFSLAEAAIEASIKAQERRPLLISVVVDENSLLDRTALDEFLDIATAWREVAGFYILVRPNDSDSPALMQSQAIFGLLYMVYVLGTINGYEIIGGFSDLIGVLLHACGVSHTATGWFKTLRQFSMARFLPSGGGRQARPRYTSASLLTSLLLLPEMDSLSRVQGALDVTLLHGNYDQTLMNDLTGSSWVKPLPQLHHWEALRKMCADVRTHEQGRPRLQRVQEMTKGAISALSEFKRRGAVLEASSGRHLPPWENAIAKMLAEFET